MSDQPKTNIPRDVSGNRLSELSADELIDNLKLREYNLAWFAARERGTPDYHEAQALAAEADMYLRSAVERLEGEKAEAIALLRMQPTRPCVLTGDFPTEVLCGLECAPCRTATYLKAQEKKG